MGLYSNLVRVGVMLVTARGLTHCQHHRPVKQTMEPIVITVWNRSSDPKKDRSEDAFLGMFTLSSHQLVQSTQTSRLDKQYSLAKRSNRSHVSGQIHIIAERVDMTGDVRTIYRNALRVIPPEPRLVFKALLKRFLEYDLMECNDGSLLTEQSKDILNQVAVVWRIGIPFRTMM